MDLNKIGSYVASRLNKFKDDITTRAQQLAPVVQSGLQNYVNTYQKVSPYIPFAPKITTPQQIQQNWNGIKTAGSQFMEGFNKPLDVGVSQPFPKTVGQYLGAGAPELATIPKAAVGVMSLVPKVANLAREQKFFSGVQEGNQAATEERIKNTPLLRNNPMLADQERMMSNYLTGGIMMGMTTPAKGGFTNEQIKTVREGFSPEVRSAVGKFAQIVEDNPTTVNRKNLGTLGEYIDSVASAVFGKNASTLTNKQLKNAFDLIMEQADKGPGFGEFSVGLATQNARKNKEKVSSLEPITKTVPEIISERRQAMQDASRAEKLGVGQKIKNMWQDFKSKFVDDTSALTDPLYEGSKKDPKTGLITLSDGSVLRPSADVWNQIDMVRKSRELSKQFMKDQGLTDVFSSLGPDKLDEFNEYLKARHTLTGDTKAETGLNMAENKKIVRELGPFFEPIAKKVRDYTQALLDYRVETGLMDKATADMLKKKYPDYVPLTRIFSKEELANAFKGQGGGIASVSTTGLQKRVGSTRAIEDPLNSLLKMTEDTFNKGEKNKAANMLASYINLPGNPYGLRELAPGEKASHFISLFRDGKQIKYATTPEVEAAAKSLNSEQMGFIARLFSYPVRLLKTGATGVLNPVFNLTNYVKDQVSAFVNSDASLRSSMLNPQNFLESNAALLGHSGEYENMIRNAAGDTSFDIYRETPQVTSEYLASQGKLGSKIKYTVKNPGELFRTVEDIVGYSEKLTRTQQFIGNKTMLLEKGLPESEANILAARAARENTVNFGRYGSWGKVLNWFIPYLNAGIQGSRTFMRNLKDKPVQTTGKVVLTSFMPMLAATAWNLADDKRKQVYKDIQDFEFKSNFVIIPPNPTKDKEGNWNVIKIPMSQEIAALTNIVRRGVEQMYGEDPVKAKEVLSGLSQVTTSMDLTDPRSLISQNMPQLAKPEVELMSNTNLYTGKKIVPESMKNLPAGEQVYPWTSGTARKVGQLTGISPIMLENEVGTTLGTGGRILLNASDRALAATGQIPENQVGGTDVVEGITRRFAKASGGKTLDEAQQASVKGWSPQQTAAYDYLHAPKTLDDNGFPATDIRQSMAFANIRLSQPELFAREAQEARVRNKIDGTPINPLYNLPTDKQRVVLTLSTLAPGQDKSDLQKANIDWLKQYWAEAAVYRQNLIDKGTYKENPNYPKPPQASAYVQAQMDAKNWSDPQVRAYLDANLLYKNQQREALGLTPLASGSTGKKTYKIYPKSVKTYKAKVAKIPKPKKPSMKKLKTIKFKKAQVKIPKLTAKKTNSLKSLKPV